MSMLIKGENAEAVRTLTYMELNKGHGVFFFFFLNKPISKKKPKKRLSFLILLKHSPITELENHL